MIFATEVNQSKLTLTGQLLYSRAVTFISYHHCKTALKGDLS